MLSVVVWNFLIHELNLVLKTCWHKAFKKIQCPECFYTICRSRYFNRKWCNLIQWYVYGASLTCYGTFPFILSYKGIFGFSIKCATFCKSIWTQFQVCSMKSDNYTHSHILKQEVTPLVLYIEEQTKDQHKIHNTDENHYNHSCINREPVSERWLWRCIVVPHLN